jgi:hypothetical protein
VRSVPSITPRNKLERRYHQRKLYFITLRSDSSRGESRESKAVSQSPHPSEGEGCGTRKR